MLGNLSIVANIGINNLKKCFEAGEKSIFSAKKLLIYLFSYYKEEFS